MIEASLITTGNNYRIKKVMEKSKNGEEITIAYIGGSITEGACATQKEKCYAYQSYLYFKNTFGKEGTHHIKFINAGMGGTPSALGIIRYDRDVTSYGKILPDLVFIEFAVNDYEEATKGVAYESLIRKVLNAPNQPALILLFSIFKSRWNMQDDYIPIGNYYKLPMISIKNAVLPELESNRLSDDEFFADIYHPTDYGHSIMSSCIEYYFTTVSALPLTDMDITLPESALIGKDFEDLRMVDRETVDDNIRIIPGGFMERDSQLVKFATGEYSFPNNWKHTNSSGNNTFKISLNCKNLLFVYKSCQNGNFGIADIYVDDKLVTSLDSKQGGGWNNPITTLLLKEDIALNHTIEVKMAEGNEDKEFTIMAFGYSR